MVGVGAVRERQMSRITPGYWLGDWVDNSAVIETI